MKFVSVLIVALGLVSMSVAQDDVAAIVAPAKSLGQAGGAAQDIDVVFTELAFTRDPFHRHVLEAGRKKVRDAGDAAARREARRNLKRLRFGMLLPAVREQAKRACVAQMRASADLNGADLPEAVPVDDNGDVQMTAIDWDALASFIERMLPIILQLIELFSTVVVAMIGFLKYLACVVMAMI